MATKEKKETVNANELASSSLIIRVVGDSPLILNSLNNKVIHELLLPAAPKKKAERAMTLKHNPRQEFRNAPHKIEQEDAPTYLALQATSFKSALRSTAVDVPSGTSKAQMGRLTYVVGAKVGVYGQPFLHMAPVRQAGMNRTPDIRTRVILPQWAAEFELRFMEPLIRERDIIELMGVAGQIQGVGDWRPEKGSGDFGRFRVAFHDDPEYASIVAIGGRAAQIAGIARAEPYDEETAELLSWFDEEADKRGLKVAA